MSGRIHQLSISPGGVPKLPIDESTVSSLGLAGDDHNDKRHHGGLAGAVCLFSLEVIEALKEEGHQIFPGATGENITVSGIEWSEVVPGSQWRLGEEVEIEVTSYTTPCQNQVNWFIEGDFTRINHKKNPGWSRVYARVLTEGRIRTGDAVIAIRQYASASDF